MYIYDHAKLLEMPFTITGVLFKKLKWENYLQ